MDTARTMGVTESAADTVDSPQVAPTEASRHVPTRTCVGCRGRGDRAELLRVVAVGSELVPDIAACLPGRGAWLHLDLDCVVAATRRRAFSRALRVPGPLDESAVQLLVQAHVEEMTTVHRVSGSKKP
jgi:predicted RNA-binding protein YlxR (DUF448 family)